MTAMFSYACGEGSEGYKKSAKVIGVGCSAEEARLSIIVLLQLNDIGSRLEELFQGGLQAMIKNVNSLAPVFAGGCNLTDEFRQCASFLFTGRTPCVVSSCLIRAGEGICDQPDPTKAIDDNLSCVFAQGASCMSEFMSSTPGTRCSAIQNAATCMAKQVRDTCGDDALTYSFAAMNDYARMMDSRCRVDKPSVSIATGCSEKDMVAYLACESAIDPFSFRPVSIIGDGSKWDDMCTAFSTSYKPCVEKMSCKFEPVSSANMLLFDGICNRPLTLRDQKSYGRCLSDYTNSAAGQKCIAAMASVDPMASDAASKMCQPEFCLTCAGNDIEKECGYGALLHVYEQHTQWAQAYNKSCVIESPEPKSVPTNTLDQSKDVEPQHVIRDEMPPPSVVLQKDTTPIVINIGETITTTSEMTTTPPMEETMSSESTTSHPKDITTTTVKGSTTSVLSVLLVFVITLRVF
ncbi:hypothetical protein OSTOST_09320 [Ostertagia ostertagi]